MQIFSWTFFFSTHNFILIRYFSNYIINKRAKTKYIYFKIISWKILICRFWFFISMFSTISFLIFQFIVFEFLIEHIFFDDIYHIIKCFSALMYSKTANLKSIFRYIFRWFFFISIYAQIAKFNAFKFFIFIQCYFSWLWITDFKMNQLSFVFTSKW